MSYSLLKQGCIVVQLAPVSRFEMASADGAVGGSQGEFCAFEFPGCEGCQYALHAIKTVKGLEDPMKSEALRAWVAGASRPKKEFFAPIRVVSYGEVHSQGEPGPVQETSR